MCVEIRNKQRMAVYNKLYAVYVVFMATGLPILVNSYLLFCRFNFRLIIHSWNQKNKLFRPQIQMNLTASDS